MLILSELQSTHPHSPPPTEYSLNDKPGTNRTKSGHTGPILVSNHTEGSTDLDVNNQEAWAEFS